MAVVAQGAAHEAQFAGRVALSVKPRIGIGGGLVGVVAAALAFEVFRVPGTAILGAKALVASPAWRAAACLG